MKKIIICIIIFMVCGCSNTKELSNKETTSEYMEELIQLGYTSDTISKLEEKLDEEIIEIITEHDYVEVILDIINDKDFKIENLSKYLEYYENGMNGNAIVYIINNDIKYTYNERLVLIMNHRYFIATNLDRYMKYESEDIDEVITKVNTNIDRKFYTNIEKTDNSKGILLIANKYYQLENGYYYGELVNISNDYSVRSGQKLNSEAYKAFKELVKKGEDADVYIRNLSAYRSYTTQKNLYQNYKSQNGQEWADKWSARAGHSEHQTGLALDVTKKGMSSFDGFEKTKEFTWLKDNAHLYGFILRYPKDKTYITGYGYEPWHYRYVGVDAAKYIYENDITFEEYYAYFVENNSAIE